MAGTEFIVSMLEQQDEGPTSSGEAMRRAFASGGYVQPRGAPRLYSYAELQAWWETRPGRKMWRCRILGHAWGEWHGPGFVVGDCHRCGKTRAV